MRTFPGHSLQGLRLPLTDPLQKQAWKIVREEARRYLVEPLPVARDLSAFNPLLGHARIHQRRVFTVLTAWWITRDERFRDHALACLRELLEWPNWNSSAALAGHTDPPDFFDLTYGENAFTLAVGFDLLWPELSPQDQKAFAARAWERVLRAFLAQTDRSMRPLYWFGSAWSNQNSVNCGGAALLALALEGALPRSGTEKVIRRAEESLAAVARGLEQMDGGWPEGVGYWNYGMRYYFYHALSWETAGRGPHPALAHPAIRATLRFPVAFSPWGVAAGFGDVNGWRPLPFHLAAAEKLGDNATLAALWAVIGKRLEPGTAHGIWAAEAEILMLGLRPRLQRTGATAKGPVARRFAGLEWLTLADREVKPGFHAAIRGGEAPLSHGHLDLLSFNAVVAGEAVLQNIPLPEYAANTFGHRRPEIPEITAPYKNTLLINGIGPFCPEAGGRWIGAEVQRRLFPWPPGEAGEPVGPFLKSVKVSITPPYSHTRVATRELRNRNGAGFALLATEAYGYDAPEFFVGRCFWLTREGDLLVIDHTRRGDGPGRVETRWHTRLPVAFGETCATIHGKKGDTFLHFGSTVPTTLADCRLPSLDPAQQFTTLRWVTEGRAADDLWLYTLITRDPSTKDLSGQASARGLEIRWKSRKGAQRLALTPGLEPGR